MNAQELRTWLENAVGKEVNFQGVESANMQGTIPAVRELNDLCQLYFPIQVERVQKPNGSMELRVRNSTMDVKHGVYLPDFQNQCTWTNASANHNQIIFSGRFSGCTFARCLGAGNQFVGHIYVSSGADGNDPAAQARNFVTVCGGQPGTAIGFRTINRVEAPASYGYVVGTCIGNQWQWNWMTVARPPSNDPYEYVVACRTINPDEWVAL
jgi:hypothetical protein